MGSVDKQWTKQTVKCLTPLGEVSLSSFLGGGRLQLYEETMIHHKNLIKKSHIYCYKWDYNPTMIAIIFGVELVNHTEYEDNTRCK